MKIEEKDFKLIPIDDSSPFFDLEVLYTVNKGKTNERQEFRNAAYGIPLESALQRIAQYRISKKFDEESIGIATYLNTYKDIIKEIKELCNT